MQDATQECNCVINVSHELAEGGGETAAGRRTWKRVQSVGLKAKETDGSAYGS